MSNSLDWFHSCDKWLEKMKNREKIVRKVCNKGKSLDPISSCVRMQYMLLVSLEKVNK